MGQEKTVYDSCTGRFLEIEQKTDGSIILRDPKSGDTEHRYESGEVFREEFREEDLFVVPREVVQRPVEYLSQRINELRQYEEKANVYDVGMDYALEVTEIEDIR